MLTDAQISAIKVAITVFEQRAALGDHHHSRCLQALLAAHSAGAQEPEAIPDGWMLVKRERIEEIRQYARTEFVNSYLGRNLYDEGSLMKNERIGEEALSNIRDVLSWIEEDEKDRIADHPQPQPQTDAARDAKDAKRYRWIEKKLRLGPPIGPRGAPKTRHIIANINLGHGPESAQTVADVIDAEIERGEREGE